MKASQIFAWPVIGRRAWQVWWRDFYVFMKTYRVNFVPPIIEPLLYFGALGFGLGALVIIPGYKSYAEFIAPALIAITIMNASFFECTFASFVRMYFQRTFDAIIATPLTVDEVIAGEMLWGATRSVISATIVLGVITIFGYASYPIALLIIPFSFLGGLLFATLAMCFTAVTPRIDSLNYPTSLFIAPMFLVSGTFFPLDRLPSGIQTFATWFVPLVPVVKITRGITTGQLDVDLIAGFVWILAVTAVFFVLAVNLMKRRLIV